MRLDAILRVIQAYAFAPLLRLPVAQVHKVGGPHRRKSTAARRGTGPAGGGESPSRCPPRQLPPRMRPPTVSIPYTSQSAVRPQLRAVRRRREGDIGPAHGRSRRFGSFRSARSRLYLGPAPSLARC